jgi:hypothetical protein
LLRRLLELPIRNKEDLQSKIEGAKVRTIEEYGDAYGSIEFDLATESPLEAPLPIAEGRSEDIDGVSVDVILYTRAGQPAELEILRSDGLPLVRMPDPESFRVWLFGEPDSAIPPW